MSDKSNDNNSDDSDSPSEDNSYLKKDDEDMDLEDNEKENKKEIIDKTKKAGIKKEKDNYLSLFSKNNLFPKRFPLIRKRARKISFGNSSSSSDEYELKIKTDLKNNYFQSLTEFQKSQAKSEKEIFESNFTTLKIDYKIIE